MGKVLKNLKPTIRSCLGDAFCFSIIDDLAFDTGWVYDKYIHLKYTPDDGQIKYKAYDYYKFVPGEGVFVKSFLEYPQKFCSQNYICSIIQQMIDNDEYCFALWDEHIVTNYLYNEQNEEVYEHGCFIYGYDDEKKFSIHKVISKMTDGKSFVFLMKFFIRQFLIVQIKMRLR